MTEISNQDEAIELLQELGLKEYEAKCFVALCRLPQGTAKDISEISDVPRTRVYDAIRVLETKGLAEVQHGSPQQFRAVSIEEAASTLSNEFETRVEQLKKALQGIESATVEHDVDATHDIWAISEGRAITNRTRRILDDATEEIVLILGDESVVTDELIARLRSATERGVSVLVGTTAAELRETVEAEVPDAEVFVSGLEWLNGAGLDRDETRISRLLLADRSTILVSSFHEGEGREQEQAVFGEGFNNGLVTIVRRLMATGLLPTDDPKSRA
jgi:sugar-specific transcriptional regulator TrmB